MIPPSFGTDEARPEYYGGMVRYAITDRQMLGTHERDCSHALIAQVSRLALQGVDLIQLRETDLPEADLEVLTSQLCDAMRGFGETAPKLLVNGPARVAIASGADGVHLRGGASAEELRAVRLAFKEAGRRPPVLSVSCHSVEEIGKLTLFGADFILFGPVFEKRVHGMLVTPGLGMASLREACKLTSLPNILALGGITEQNASLCVESGAVGIAGIRMFYNGSFNRKTGRPTTG